MKTTKATRSTKRIAKKIAKPASTRGKNPKTPKTKKKVAAKRQATISNPRRKSSVFLNSTPKRSKIAKTARKKPVGKTARKPLEPVVRAVHQPDSVSCGWATTKWLLQSFNVLDVTDKQLRAELNTDAERGIHAWWNRRIAAFVRKKFGKDLELSEGTLPMAIYSALRKRGIVLKNPVRLERFSNYTDYLNDTFRAGGRAAILLWRWNDGLMHWMGVIRQKSQIKIMDPARGRYVSFQQGISYWEYDDHKPEFLVFGFVRK